PGPPEGRDAILNELYSEFDRIIGELSEAPALILDLRGNPGGTDLLGHFLIDRLVEPGYVYGQLSSRRPWGWSKFAPLHSSAPPGTNSLRAPLVCLIDEDTFSTADNVVACLADVHPDVRFVGRPNGAGSGAPRDFVLPRTRTRMYLSTMRVRSPVGRSIEGLSVPLDSHVDWSREDVLQGRDPDVREALRLLEPR
ncbi:MAG: S41 family peptidase, partial [Planctomycetota bacterium]